MIGASASREQVPKKREDRSQSISSGRGEFFGECLRGHVRIGRLFPVWKVFGERQEVKRIVSGNLPGPASCSFLPSGIRREPVRSTHGSLRGRELPERHSDAGKRRRPVREEETGGLPGRRARVPGWTGGETPETDVRCRETGNESKWPCGKTDPGKGAPEGICPGSDVPFVRGDNRREMRPSLFV